MNGTIRLTFFLLKTSHTFIISPAFSLTTGRSPLPPRIFLPPPTTAAASAALPVSARPEPLQRSASCPALSTARAPSATGLPTAGGQKASRDRRPP
jgi:hypothetical protein